jgi:hypothetical protein
MHHVMLPFSPGNFLTKSNVTVIPHPLCFSLFPQLKIKLKGCHFNTFEAIKAELQAVLNSFTEPDFQDVFKKLAEVLGMVHRHRRLLHG